MEEKRNLNIKAVIIGWLIDNVGTFIAEIFIGIITGFIFVSKGIPPDQIAEEFSNSAALRNILLFVGFSFTFLGGYIAALIAKTDELKHALLVGVLSLMTSLLLTSVISPQGSIYYLIALFVIPFAVLGGYLRKITKRDPTN